MQPQKKLESISSLDISSALKTNFYSLLSSFYETQSAFLTGIYKMYGGTETANIILCFARNIHLTIIRQREINLTHDVSLKNFWNNLDSIKKPSEKISSIVQITGIPKETVRRKINKLLDLEFLATPKNIKGYHWNHLQKHKDISLKAINDEIVILSKFTYQFSKLLKLNLSLKSIEDELKMQFSFYWYHFLSCQIMWLRMWQEKLKDNDLLLIILQTVIPTLQYANKYFKVEKKEMGVDMNNVFKFIGKVDTEYNFTHVAVSATTVAQVTGIPRATCIRKLDRLVFLGFLLREKKTKRYYVNQNTMDRTKNILTRDNVNFTIENFSKYISIILNSIINSKK